jgi:hypothetical protein
MITVACFCAHGVDRRNVPLRTFHSSAISAASRVKTIGCAVAMPASCSMVARCSELAVISRAGLDSSVAPFAELRQCVGHRLVLDRRQRRTSIRTAATGVGFMRVTALHAVRSNDQACSP